MRRFIAIPSLLLAYVVMSLLLCVPHHHHNDSICFDWEQSEVDYTHHDASCCHDHKDEHGEEQESHTDTDCSILSLMQEVLNDAPLRVACPDVVGVLPEWCSECEERVELELLAAYRWSDVRPIVYDSPDVGVRALRAPPAV